MKIVAQLLIASTSLAIGLLSAPGAQALDFTEGATDVEELIGTAGIVDSDANLITGSIDTRTVNGAEVRDVDLFKVQILTTQRSRFDANPIEGSGLNINMFLFDGLGKPLFSLEPRDSNSMTIEYDTIAGSYYLGISSDDLNAFDSLDNLIANNDEQANSVNGVIIFDPALKAPGGILDRWSPGNESVGGYTIGISKIPTPVPTPALLPGLVGLGLKVMWRKQKENATSNPIVEA
jgi:hypothetical protein